jgi:glycosyltransferase involved in cell wall biosynthesis
MTKLRVGVVNSEVRPCHFYRAYGPAKVLHDQGEIELVDLPPTLRVRYANRRHGLQEPVGLIDVPPVDLVCFVRGIFPAKMQDIVRFLQQAGIAVIADVDDLYRHLSPGLLNRYKISPAVNPAYSWANVEQACKIVDMVTCSTEPLKRYAPHGRVRVLENAVPARYLDIGREAEPRRDGKVVGWGGTVAGHLGDLRECRAGVAEALRQNGGRFLNVGDGVGVARDLGLDELEATGIVSFDQYSCEIARFDVGIAPLVPGVYASSKSWLKAIESLAMGSVVVTSDTPEYVRLYQGLKAWCTKNAAPVPMATVSAKARTWRRELSAALARSDAERAEVAEVARAYIEEYHLMEKRAHLWGEAFELAVERQRQAQAA